MHTTFIASYPEFATNRTAKNFFLDAGKTTIPTIINTIIFLFDLHSIFRAILRWSNVVENYLKIICINFQL
uniref:Uncharacterized protein n=1 Tax=Megaselia scalaris TaxID=36166 RepID=T1GEY6_MEGSC